MTGTAGSPARTYPSRRPARVLVSTILAAGLFVAFGNSPALASSPPTTPGSFTASNVTSSSAVLKWTAATDDVAVVGYRIYRARPSTGSLTLIQTLDSGVLTYTAANLRSGTSYAFAVAAIDADNQESTRASKTLTTPSSSDSTAPAAPSSTSVVATAFSSSRVDVIWGASTSTDVSYYEVVRNGVVVGTVDRPAATRFSDTGLTASTTYSYQVRAVDSAGNRSALTTARAPKTLATGTVKIVRGPYVLSAGTTSAVVHWWTNISSSGSLTSSGGSPGSDTSTDGLHHTVTVTGLSAGTSYTYTVSSGGVTAAGSFRTARSAGQAYTFAVIGDYGAQSTAEASNASRIAGYGSDFLLTVGDNVYPSSGFVDPNVTTTYSDLDARIFKQFAPVLAKEAFFPGNGNKEYYGNGGFWNAFPLPATSGAPANSYYSFDWGDAHVLVLDEQRPYTSGSAQYNFVQSDLAAHQSATWRIVMSPNPPYSSTTSATNSGNTGVRTSLVPLFQAGHVNLVLSGDSHNYQRSKPLNASGNPVTSGGITYIVTGGGGNGLAQFTGGAMPSWQAYREASIYESLKIQVSATGLTVQAISATDGSVIDSTTLGTSTPPPPDTTAPTTPTGLTGTPADTSVALSWTASTDNVGVAHYNVYRNGTQIAGAAPTGTTYTDTGLTPGTAYSYTVSASDAAGNTSGQSAAFATTTTTTGGGGGTTVTVTPTNDSTIDPVTTDSISSTRLKADASAPKNDLLMKFTVPSTCATVTAASLTLTVGSASTDPSVRGGDFYATSPGDTNAGWSESSVVWASAPVATGSPVSLAGAVAANTAYTVNATSIVQAAGGTGAGTTFTLRGSNTSGDGAGYYSKEGSTTSGPQLILTCG